MHAHSFAYAQIAFFALIQFRASCLGTGVTHSGLSLLTSVKAINNHPQTSPHTTWSRQAFIEALFPGVSKLCMVTVKTYQNMIMENNLAIYQYTEHRITT